MYARKFDGVIVPERYSDADFKRLDYQVFAAIMSSRVTEDDPVAFDVYNSGFPGVVVASSGYSPRPSDPPDMRKINEFFKNNKLFFGAEQRGKDTVLHVAQNSGILVIAAVLPVIFRDRFERKPLTPEERDLITACTQWDTQDHVNSASAVCARLAVLGRRSGNYAEWLKHSLTETQTILRAHEVNTLERQVTQFDDQRKQLLDRLEQVSRDRAAAIERLWALENRPADEGFSELVDYLSELDGVTVETIFDGTLRFSVASYLTFDPEGISATPAETQWVFKAIAEGRLKLRMNARYDLDFNGSRVYSDSRRLKDSFPNPHLLYHHCMGGFIAGVEGSLFDGDLVGAVEQCIFSAGSVNLKEGITARKLIRDLNDTSIRAFQIPGDEKLYTIEEAKKKLCK